MREMLRAFVEKTGFDGLPPLPKEAVLTVSLAKHLPKAVQYQGDRSAVDSKSII